MTRNQDARPFVDLLKDAEEFKAKFDDDIKRCIKFLDGKITALIRDPDSLGNPKRGINSNPVVEFSKAKYEIFVGARSMMNDMEREWLKYISEMKKLFVENVEIFLAGTKLEVKLPTNEFQSSPGFKKSPRKQEQSSITSTIYPLINSFAKNVAALSSPLRLKDSTAQKRSSKKASNDLQLSTSDETSEDESVKTGRKSSHFGESMKPTVRITKADESAAKASQRKSALLQVDTDTDESSEYGRKTPKSRGTKEKSSTSDLDTSVSKSGGRRNKQIIANCTSDLNRSRSSSGFRSISRKELKNLSDSPDLNRSRSSSGSRSISRNELKNLSDSPGLNRSRSSSGHRSKLENEDVKLNNSPDLNRSRTSSNSKSPGPSKELKKLSNSPDLNRSRTSSNSKSRGLSKELKNLSNSPGFEASPSNSVSTGRHSSGRKSSRSSGFEAPRSNSASRDRNSSGRKSSSSSAERPKKSVEKKEVQTDESSSDSNRERGRQQRKSVKTPKQKGASVKLTSMTEEKKKTETEVDDLISNRMGKGRNSKQLVKNTKLMDTSVEQQEKVEESDETETENKTANSKGANKGRKSKKSVRSTKEEVAKDSVSPKRVASKATRNQSKSVDKPKISSEESEDIDKDEQINDINEASSKRARGRSSKRQESVHSNPKKAKYSTKQETAKSKTATTDESETEEDNVSTRRNKGKQAAKDKSIDVISNTPGRASRRAAIGGFAHTEQSPKKSNLVRSNESVVLGVTKSPKKVTFTKDQVLDDDLDDMYTPAKSSKPALRRKTLLPNLDELSDITPGSSRAKSKRKTIGGASDLSALTPPKRLRVSETMKNVSSSQDDEDTDDNPLESDGNYTHWIPLKSVDAKIPTRPAIYEVKVSRAKKSAYIGCCDSLRQKLTLYKLRQNSGHKHLDKFIDRNINDVQIRYEVVSSVNDAKGEVKNRINSFVAQYKTTPAYN